MRLNVLEKQISMHPQWFEAIRSKLQGYPEWAVEVGTYGVIGLLLGFVAKNFGKSLIMVILAASVMLWALSALNLITVDVSQLKGYLGLSSVANLDEGIRLVIDWFKAHSRASMALVVGLFLGWVLG
ncbi:MAG TPA: FUN14 domain-containing protein [Candidatus Babeliaceae bacterium]|nr:FUN14 domain-containing protein [Candidatus Babeliaceae bacterium]